MAVAISAPTTAVASTSNATTYSLGSFTPTANALLIVMVFCTGLSAGSNMSNTGTALTWTPITNSVISSNGITYDTNDQARMYMAQVPSSVSASVISFNVVGGNGTGCVMICFQITGHNPTFPQAAVVYSAATSTNVTMTVPAKNTNNAYVAGWGGQLGAGSSTPPTSWTENGDVSYNNPTSNGAGAFRAGGETSTSVAFTNTSTNWGAMYVEINEATVGNPAQYANSLMMSGLGT
jgi:hypothetical protein